MKKGNFDKKAEHLQEAPEIMIPVPDPSAIKLKLICSGWIVSVVSVPKLLLTTIKLAECDLYANCEGKIISSKNGV